MCYPKPGPRCSAHAFKSFERARSNLAMASVRLKNKKDPSSEEMDSYMELKSLAETARWDFYKTPGGQQYIDKTLLIGLSEAGTRLTDIDRVQLEEAKVRSWQEREQDLHAFKKLSISGSDVSHGGEGYTQSASSFLKSGDVRHGWSNENEELTNGHEFYDHQTTAWADSLSVQDRKDILHWTSDGHRDITRFLISGKLPKPRSRADDDSWQDLSEVAQMKDYISRMDAILERGTPHRDTFVVYRGVGNSGVLSPEVKDKLSYIGVLDDNPDLRQEVEDDVERRFARGTVVSMPYFQSSSLNPEIATKFTHASQIVFEIKTKRVSPVGAFSVQNNEEAEVLLPRDTKFRVVDVQKRVTFSKIVHYYGGTQEKEEVKYTVVQLEEVD